MSPHSHVLIALAAGAVMPISASAQSPATPYADVSDYFLPVDPTLHALDAEFIDFDRDGDLDIAIAVEYGVNRLYVNDGHGRFSWKKGAFGSVPHDSEHVVAADLNADGYKDLVFIAEDDRTHQLFLGGPGGAFTDASDRLPSRSEGNALAIADLNGDRLPDIVIGNTNEKGAGSAQDFVWFNDPKRPGHFIDATKRALPKNEQGTQGIVLADINGDGKLDMVTAQQDGPNRLLLNGGNGSFHDASDRLDLKVPMETREVHVFDANGDGKPDILYFNLTSNNHGWEKDPQTRLLLNDGTGRFRDVTVPNLPSHTFSSWGGEIVDFNQDGAPDIIVGAIQVPGFVPLQVRAWRNDGQGRFEDTTLETIPGGTVGRSWSMAKGDLDGDGKDDLFIGQWGTQAKLLLTNRAALEQPKSPRQHNPVDTGN